MNFRRMVRTCTGILLTLAVGSALADGCPAFSSEVTEAGDVVTCRCITGYHNQNGQCVPVATASDAAAAPPHARAACMHAAGLQLRHRLEKCRSPLVFCLKSAGVRQSLAMCTATALISAAPNGVKTLLSTLASCGDTMADQADRCVSTWSQCEEMPLAQFKTEVAACPED